MRSIFFPVVMLAVVAASTVHPAHAEHIHGFMNGQPFSGNVYSGPSGFGAGFAEGLGNSLSMPMAQDAAIPGHRYWMSFDGEHHDCSYDPPSPLAIAFGAKCRVSQ